MHCPRIPRTGRHRLHAALTALMLGALAVPHSHAQTAPTSHFDIPAQPLDAALRALAQQSGREIFFTPELTRDKTSGAVSGRRGDLQALEALLQGTDLEYRITESNAILIHSPGVKALDAVMVFGTLDESLGIGSKTGQSLRETPKSVTVMTRERLDAQNLTTLNSAMAQTTGVTVSAFGPIDNFYYSRGFRVTTFQIDGGAPATTGTVGAIINPDLAIVDHVEMLRGVDGMYSGAGDPGGVINMVRKRPTRDFQARLNLTAGSWDSYRGEVDVSGPLAADGRLRGRGVVAYENKRSFIDRYQPEKFVGYGVLEYDLTDRLTLTVGADMENSNHKGDPGWAGLMRYSDGTDLGLGRGTSFNTEWDSTKYDNREYFANLEQKYGETGVLKVNLTRMQQDYQYRGITVLGPVDPDTGLGPYYWVDAANGNVVQDLFDASATGRFSLFGQEHRYTIGADYSKISNDGLTEFAPTADSTASWPVDLDVFNFDPSAFPYPQFYRSGHYPEYQQAQRGFYGTLGLQLADPLRLTLGGRHGKWDYRQRAQYYAEDGSEAGSAYVSYSDSKFIPSAALSYDLAEKWTAYLSYGETFAVQSRYLDAAGQPLDPMTGTGWELGIKGEPGHRLNTSFAIFRVIRSGQATRDPAYPFTPGERGSYCCYLPGSRTTSEGFDAEVSGAVLPGLQLFAGYTFNQFETVGSPGSYILNATPKHIFKAWGTWQLPGALSAWTVNAGAVIQSRTSLLSSVYRDGEYQDYTFGQSGMAIWNAALQYRISDAWSVGLYAENLGDKHYYTSLGSADYENNYAAPRNYTLTFRGNW